MKVCLAFALFALAAATPSVKVQPIQVANLPNAFVEQSQDRSLLVNLLINSMFAYIRHVINNGSLIFRIPPLDPFFLEDYHLYIPAGLINLDLNLKNIQATGFGGFKVKRSHLNLSAMTFDLEISVPKLDIGADEYDLTGDFYSAIPLYGKGKARFQVENFIFAAKLFLKQSEDKKSVLIDRIESATFDIPALKSSLTGVIGGGDIDAVVNAVIEEVIIDYINRFEAAIASFASSVVIKFGNPILDQLDTWKYISPLMPRST